MKSFVIFLITTPPIVAVIWLFSAAIVGIPPKPKVLQEIDHCYRCVQVADYETKVVISEAREKIRAIEGLSEMKLFHFEGKLNQIQEKADSKFLALRWRLIHLEKAQQLLLEDEGW